jgi:hypothetical protein
MAASNGLEKFSHLEDKIYRTIELTKTLRQEKDDLERQLATLRNQGGNNQEIIADLDRLMTEREAIRAKVQHLLETVTAAESAEVEEVSE